MKKRILAAVSAAVVIVLAVLAAVTWKFLSEDAPVSVSPTPTVAPTATMTPTITPTPSPVPTATPTVAPTATPVPTSIPTPTVTVEPTSTPVATPTNVPTVTVAPTATSTSTPTPVPTATPTVTPTVAPTSTPTPTPTAAPTATPVPTSTPTPTATPKPTAVPTATPSPTPEAGKIWWTGKIGDDVTGTFYADGTYVISGTGATYDFYYNMPQNAKSQASAYRNDVVKIVVEEGITELGNQVCSQLYNCREIVLPKSLTKIGEFTFRDTGRNGAWDENMDYLDDSNCWTTSINLDETSVVEIGDHAFGYTTIQLIELPETLVKIGADAFHPWYSKDFRPKKHSLVIPANVEYIGKYALANAYKYITIKGKSSLEDFDGMHEEAFGINWAQNVYTFEP